MPRDQKSQDDCGQIQKNPFNFHSISNCSRWRGKWKQTNQARFFSIYSEAAGGLKGGLMKWMHGCREVKRTSVHVKLQRKMKVKHSGEQNVCFCYRSKHHRIPSRGEKQLSFIALFQESSCHLCSRLFINLLIFFYCPQSVAPGPHKHIRTHMHTQSYLFSSTLMVYIKLLTYQPEWGWLTLSRGAKCCIVLKMDERCLI